MGLDKAAIMATLIRKATPILHEASSDLVEVFKKNLSMKVGIPSVPGEYPAKQSGDLVRSVHTETRRVGLSFSYFVIVGEGLAYADPLDTARPYMMRTVNENKERILAAMAAKWNSKT